MFRISAFIILLTTVTCITMLNSQSLSQKYLQNKTVTYDEAISFYKSLDAKYANAKLITCGMTDAGKALHLFVITNDADFDPASIRRKNKRILLINNGIHPGEPCGTDACLGLSEDLLSKKDFQKLLDHVVICIIPVYNIDGAFNRNSWSRMNQNGPEEYGFRGNARNLDLNRDFIKCDAENTKSFIKIFREWQPEIFVDTHISDGADYQYTMTLIPTQQNKLHPALATYMTDDLLPKLSSKMKERNWEMCAYIDPVNEIPDNGISAFLETPRFSTGYTTLFNTIGFITETHMLKPYPDQVKATYTFLYVLIEEMNNGFEKIKTVKQKADDDCARIKTSFDLQWEPDTTKFEMTEFKGYEAKHKKSNITGLDRLYYDRSQPYTRPIKNFDFYKSTVSVEKPYAYLVPQCWHEVIERFELNKIKMHRLVEDSVIEVEVYYITNYKSPQKPFEGRYLHTETEVSKEIQKIHFYKGDYVIVCDQSSNRFIVETLEPKGVDSYFAWNFFDAVLQQKEWFSDYVFEEKAEELLKDHPDLKVDLENYVKDNKLENDHRKQLAYIYRHSPYFEKSAMRYPVFRLNHKHE